MSMRTYFPANTLKHTGFTLLEVMVAMVLIAAIGMAVYSWINSSLMSLNRVQEHGLRQRVTRNALAYMKTVNPMLRPAGEEKVGAYSIEWQATPINDPVQGAGHPAGESLYELALYDTNVTIYREDNKIVTFDLRQVGYRQTREFKNGFGL